MQDYQLVVRTLGPATDLVTGVDSYSEFRDYIQQMYLGQGYEILDITLLEKVATNTHTFAYHLVKNIVETPKTKTDK